MVSITRMREIRRIVSKAIFNKRFQDLTESQSLTVARKVKQVIKKEKK